MARIYSEMEKIEAIAAYITTGAYTKAGDLVGISHNTIRAWHDRDPEFWEHHASRIRAEFEDAHRAKLGKIISAGLNEALERLNNGDERYDAKTGKHVRVKVGGKDAATIAAICFDKMRISLGQPTSIQGKAQGTDGDKLAALKQMARDKAKQDGIEAGSIAELKPGIEAKPAKETA